MSRGLRANPTAGFVIAILALALLTLAGFWGLGPEQPKKKEQLVPDAAEDEPLPGGNKVNLADAIRQFDEPIYRPNLDIASDATIQEIWVRPKEIPETYLIYESGIILIIRPAEETQPTKEFAEAQLAEGVPGQLVKIRGMDAFVIEQVSPESHGSVGFVLQGTSVNVIGDGDFSSKTLTSVAESIVDGADKAVAEDL